MTARDDAELKIESLGEELDGADIFLVIGILADAEGMAIQSFLDEMRIGRDLIAATQSNYKRAYATIREMAKIADDADELEE